MLTRKQHELLMYVNQCINKDGVSPSFDEMKDALGLRSKSGIHRLITGLEERGFIRRLPHRARALEILRLPQDAGLGAPVGLTRRKDHPSNVIRPDFKSGPTPVRVGEEAVVLPLYGRIAAGMPIEAIHDPNNTISVPPSMLSKGDHYALEVDGESMIDAGIHDGDTAIIKRCDTAENGSIVVALIADHEVTLKRLRRKGNSIALEPANPKFETRIFGPDQVKVQGKLVGILRKY